MKMKNDMVTVINVVKAGECVFQEGETCLVVPAYHKEFPLNSALLLEEDELVLQALADKVVVQGPLEKLRGLAARPGTTMVYVPTHLSNLDSILFGYALMAAGLPPATYGAGKNLFTNPLLSFFMHNLGAYRVDRRLRYGVYKDVLKAYSGVLLERGYHSLFFPGGTRSRSVDPFAQHHEQKE